MRFEGAPVRSTLDVSNAELETMSRALLDAGHRLALVAAHDDGESLRIVYVFARGAPDTRTELVVRVDAREPRVASLAAHSFAASRFEREMSDLFGIEPLGHPQPRRLVLHQHWPEGWHPMRRTAGEAPPMVSDAGEYPFLVVEGTGVYEIPVGPVHAGLIEPGHFRFSAVGETILRMKARLWFVHKGIERLMQAKSIEEGLAIAERISGDSAVGHSTAYLQAVEEALGMTISAEDARVRAALLEMERLYNHVGDLGALCNDVGYSIANSRALSIREGLLRLNQEITGHRLLRGAVVLGGSRARRLASVQELAQLTEEVDRLTSNVRSNALVRDRFAGTAVLSRSDAEQMGALGVVARASGLGIDARLAHPSVTLPEAFRISRSNGGDVLARFDVRVQEVASSLELLKAWSGVDLSTHREVDARAMVRIRSDARASGLGIVEGWRGTIVHRVELDDDGRLSRVKIVDPSFFNWPALAISLADTIVPDFPLVNKSFNLSYAGNDL